MASWTLYQLVLAAVMLVTGSINTLSTKWADISTANGDPKYDEQYPDPRTFNHPFFQAVCMFIGESSCLLVFKLIILYKTCKRKPIDIGDQKFSPLVMLALQCVICVPRLSCTWPFLGPCSCVFLSVLPMYCSLGLNLTYASTFQMLRGAVVIFTGLLSVAFLNRRLRVYQWWGIFLVFLGLIVVGLADVIAPPSDQKSQNINNIITGDLLIIMAQIITASQMVIEEKFLSKYNVQPLQAVGWEGIFGFTVLSILLVPFYFIQLKAIRVGVPDYRLEDAIDALFQLHNNSIILVATIGTILSIAFFNFAGISVTKEMCTTRMVLDSLRTVVIWAVCRKV
ncbi:putative transmembrane protein C2orf18 [Apostichopus japonicus]|uniref:Putative transmembrane protein C2orf18 n=1 Tax=Stichopus japonicus TaxID=307972 RepID=A0A2G8L4A0_STIJA|nr:putative transmembrane protein C2orf18 [Apostichopus japonicus]